MELTDAQRGGGLTFAAGVPEADRAWIRAAVASARPEARRLIDEADGAVEVFALTDARSLSGGGSALGIAEQRSGSLRVGFDLPVLNGGLRSDREAAVLHELGHIVDFTVVGDDLRAELDRLIPPGRPCESAVALGACAEPEERFADTFMKWALYGKVSAFGSGYAVPTPGSLADWGAPLDALALRLDRER